MISLLIADESVLLVFPNKTHFLRKHSRMLDAFLDVFSDVFLDIFRDVF